MNRVRVVVHHLAGLDGIPGGPPVYGFADPPPEVGLSAPPWRRPTVVLRRAEVRVPTGSDIVPDWGLGVTVLRWSFGGVEYRAAAAEVLAHADAGRLGFAIAGPTD